MLTESKALSFSIFHSPRTQAHALLSYTSQTYKSTQLFTSYTISHLNLILSFTIEWMRKLGLSHIQISSLTRLFKIIADMKRKVTKETNE